LIELERILSKPILNTLVPAVIAGLIAGAGAGYFAAGYNQSGATSEAENVFSQDAVRSIIMARPEIIEDAFYALQKKRQAEADAAKKVSLVQSQSALFNDKNDPIMGADDAPFVVVEFFDYNCGYCKLASKWMKTTLENQPGNIKVIMKDFPILDGRGNGSRLASEAAWAVHLQGREIYTAFHFALMDARGGFDTKRIDDIAAGHGVDVARMHKDMKNNAKAFEDLMQVNYALASQLGINGTPAFITGDTIITGADTEKLQTMMDAALTEES
jgi:protein-disulfide isomerase